MHRMSLARGRRDVDRRTLIGQCLLGWVTDQLILVTTGSRGAPERDTVYLGMVFGMVLLLVMQALGTVVANAIWNRRIGVYA